MNVAPIGINRNTVNLGAGRSKSLNMSTPSNSTDTFQKSEGLSKKKAVSFEGFASEVAKIEAKLVRLEDVLTVTKLNEAKAKAEEEILRLANKLKDEDSDAGAFLERRYNESYSGSEAILDGLINAMNMY